MILLFLGSWRSTLIVCVSIPLSILTSLVVLHLLGETINVMTLGGLALAVGILVDDATVEIENIHRNLAYEEANHCRRFSTARSRSLFRRSCPLSAICIVFVPVIFLTGAARYLFTPLALAVVLAMLASYLLSRTLVPTMVQYLLACGSGAMGQKGEHGHAADEDFFWRHPPRLQPAFRALSRPLSRPARVALRHRKLDGGPLSACFARFRCLDRSSGRDFFPYVDAGQIRLHVRAPGGHAHRRNRARLRQSGRHLAGVIPAGELDDILDNIGLPYSGFNLAFERYSDDRRLRRRYPGFPQAGATIRRMDYAGCCEMICVATILPEVSFSSPPTS